MGVVAPGPFITGLLKEITAEKDLIDNSSRKSKLGRFFHCSITKSRLGENCDDAWNKSWLGRL